MPGAPLIQSYWQRELSLLDFGGFCVHSGREVRDKYVSQLWFCMKHNERLSINANMEACF